MKKTNETNTTNEWTKKKKNAVFFFICLLFVVERRSYRAHALSTRHTETPSQTRTFSSDMWTFMNHHDPMKKNVERVWSMEFGTYMWERTKNQCLEKLNRNSRNSEYEMIGEPCVRRIARLFFIFQRSCNLDRWFRLCVYEADHLCAMIAWEAFVWFACLSYSAPHSLSFQITYFQCQKKKTKQNKCCLALFYSLSIGRSLSLSLFLALITPFMTFHTYT